MATSVACSAVKFPVVNSPTCAPVFESIDPWILPCTETDNSWLTP